MESHVNITLNRWDITEKIEFLEMLSCLISSRPFLKNTLELLEILPNQEESYEDLLPKASLSIITI